MKNNIGHALQKPILQILFPLIGLCLGLTMPRIQAKAAQGYASHGTIVYQAGREDIRLYAEDILLLDEKLSSITERCFDPARYAHTHHWEYNQINEKTHTRHCAACGEDSDLTSVHSADRWEYDTIFHEGQTYSGKRFTCACGYQWRMEAMHTPSYEAVDELNHRCSCALDETPYCKGCEPSVEEHYAWYYERSEDSGQHVKICFDCGYRIEEDCCFDVTAEETDLRVCICGREAAPEDMTDASDDSDAEDEADAPDDPGTEDDPGAPDDPGTEDDPDTPDDPGTEDNSDAPNDPGTKDDPDTSDDPGTEDDPHAPDDPDTEDNPNASDDANKENETDKPGDPDMKNTLDVLHKTGAKGDFGTFRTNKKLKTTGSADISIQLHDNSTRNGG